MNGYAESFSHRAVEELMNSRKRLRESEEHSDVILNCDVDMTTFNVHKSVLWEQSKYFQKACKPENFKEGKESYIIVDSSISSATMRLVLDYMYTLDYEDRSSLSVNIDVFIAADFYMIPKLKELAAIKFKKVFTHPPPLGRATFLEAIAGIYTKTPSKDCMLRPIVLKLIMFHQEVLFDDLRFLEMMEDIPEIGKDVAISMRSSLKQSDTKWDGFRKVQCRYCQHTWADARPRIPDSVPCPGCKRQHCYWSQWEIK